MYRCHTDQPDHACWGHLDSEVFYMILWSFEANVSSPYMSTPYSIINNPGRGVRSQLIKLLTLTISCCVNVDLIPEILLLTSWLFSVFSVSGSLTVGTQRQTQSALTHTHKFFSCLGCLSTPDCTMPRRISAKPEGEPESLQHFLESDCVGLIYTSSPAKAYS